MRKPWTPAEDARLAALYPTHSGPELVRLLGRSLSAIENRRTTLGLHKTENKGRFKPGFTPWNTGTKGWQAGGRSKETQFKPGERRGRAAKIYQQIGAERISKDGYLERKINDDMPFQKRWRAVHLIEWEKINGPLPPGHALVFKNRDKTDLRIENLELVTRAELMRRNTIHNYPKPIALAVQLRGQLTRQINRRTKRDHEKHD